MKSLYETILSSTHSGKHFDPLSDLKRQDFQVREKDTIEDIVKVFVKFYKKEFDALLKDRPVMGVGSIKETVKDGFMHIYDQLHLDHMKPKGAIKLILDHNAPKVIEKLYDSGRITIDQNPPVCPTLGSKDEYFLPLVVTIDHPMWGEQYYIWYWGCTQDLFGHGANHWLEMHKKD